VSLKDKIKNKVKINRENTKAVLGAVVGFGSGMVVKTLIQSNVVGDRIDRKIGIKIGAWALGGLAAQASKEYVNARVDKVFDAYEKFKADQQ
jgi:hypothetical protein